MTLSNDHTIWTRTDWDERLLALAKRAPGVDLPAMTQAILGGKVTLAFDGEIIPLTDEAKALMPDAWNHPSRRHPWRRRRDAFVL